jgi:hypothetical protein
MKSIRQSDDVLFFCSEFTPIVSCRMNSPIDLTELGPFFRQEFEIGDDAIFLLANQPFGNKPQRRILRGDNVHTQMPMQFSFHPL